MSRHRHPDSDCVACRDCPSCEGGTARIPAYFRAVQRVTDHAGIALAAVCTDCEGRGAVCPNLTTVLEESA